jgi:hypothetical protein
LALLFWAAGKTRRVSWLKRMKLNLLISILFISCFAGCSTLDYVRYMDTQINNEWNIYGGRYVSRHSLFVQVGFQYKDKNENVNIIPESLGDYIITVGPPFIPVIPMPPIYLLPDKNKLVFDVAISSLKNNCFINLSKIKLTVNGITNETPQVLLDRDSTEFFDWEAINIHSPDSSQYVINISNNKLHFKIKSNENISHIDSVIITIEGIRINNKNISIPKLFLIRKGKFYYVPATAA